MPRPSNYTNDIKNNGGKIMNQVILVGNLCKDLSLDRLANDMCKTFNTIAVNAGKDKDGNYTSDFFDIELWNSQAEYLCKYATKGSKIGVNGRLKTDSWDSQDGTKRYRTYVVVNNIEILSKIETQEEAPKKSVSEAMKNAKKPLPITDSDVSEDMLPF